jgi:hypothetical protein
MTRTTPLAAFDNNRAVYGLLRYGVPVRTSADEYTETM